tara:strand:+ start:2092 stop:2211 length:120 start_codon:yes stop_codon:yes gene_type:complete
MLGDDEEMSNPPQGIYEYITQRGFIPYIWDWWDILEGEQ